MPEIKDDEKMPLSWILFEKRYWAKRWIANHARTVLYAVMPRWLVREAMMYASRYIKDNEVVPDVPFMIVFERVCKNDVAGRYRGTRVTK